MKHPEAVPRVEWDVVIDQLRAQTRVGIHGHERASQPVVINAVLHCRSQALPEHIGDCLDYDAFCQMLCTHAVRSAERVGVRLRWNRRDHLRWRAHLAAAHVAEATHA